MIEISSLDNAFRFAPLTDRRDIREGEVGYQEKYLKLYEEFQVLIKGIPDLLFHVDPALDVIWMNEAAKQMLLPSTRDISEDDSAVSCARFWFESADDYNFPAIQRAFATGLQQEETFEDRHQRTWGMKVFPPMNGEKGRQTAIVIASDITEKLLLRSEALRNSQMALLGHLAAGLGHEINNPINGIVNYAQLVADRLPVGSDESELMGEIIREGTRIAASINQLLVFVGDQQSQRTCMTPQSLIEDALRLAGSRLAEEDIELRLFLPRNLPELFGQRSQLQQMVLNLISNSQQALKSKFSGRRGRKVLVIRAKAVDNGKPAVIRLEFIDNGIGIDKASLAEVFDPFYTRGPQGRGKGLGLSVTRGIVKNHGGDIRISSRAGKFTKVEIDLPISE